MIVSMVSERYPKDVDEDCASASDSKNCVEDASDDDDEVLNVSSQNLESSTSQNSILVGSFESSIIPDSTISIAPVFDWFSIKIREIYCSFGDGC